MATFISYSRANSDFAVRLANDLKSAGFDVWLDQLDIPTGARWDDEIEKALEKSAIFLIILSPESIESQNVKDEVGYAIDAGKYILPVLTMACKVPLRLRRFQFVDFSNQPYEESLTEIKQLLKTSNKPAATDVTRIGAGKLEVPPARPKANPLLKNIPRSPQAAAKKPAPAKTPGMWYLALIFLGICAVAVAGFAVIMFSSPGLQSFLQPPSALPPIIGTTVTPTVIPNLIALDITVTPSVTPVRPSDTPIIPSDTPVIPSDTPVVPSDTPTVTPVPDLCAQIANQSLKLSVASGFQGVIGPSGIALIPRGNASYEFTTVAAFPNEQVDAVSGICQQNTISFTRTRPQAFTQDYQMPLTRNPDGTLSLSGSLTDRSSGKKVSVSGQVTGAVTPGGLCDRLAGKSLNISHANGFQGVIGPSGIPLIARGDGTYSFSTVAAYTNEPADPVSGSCQGNNLTFTRTRANTFVQNFQATISQNAGTLSINGSMTNSQTGKQGTWSGRVTP